MPSNLSEQEINELIKDSERLDFLESKANGDNWIARESSTGRGYRLHNTNLSSNQNMQIYGYDSSQTVREAIDKAMQRE